MKLTQEQWKFFKDRADNLDYKEDIDPRMVELVKTINDYPTFATVWCCSGHSKKENLTLPYMVIVEDPEYPRFLDECLEEVHQEWGTRGGFTFVINKTQLLADPEWNIGERYDVTYVGLEYLGRRQPRYKAMDLEHWKVSQELMVVMDSCF